ERERQREADAPEHARELDDRAPSTRRVDLAARQMATGGTRCHDDSFAGGGARSDSATPAPGRAGTARGCVTRFDNSSHTLHRLRLSLGFPKRELVHTSPMRG